MDWSLEPSAGLEQDIERLEQFLAARSDLSADARAAGLTALVNAKAVHRLIEAAEIHLETLRDDIAAPLTEGLMRFAQAAGPQG